MYVLYCLLGLLLVCRLGKMMINKFDKKNYLSSSLVCQQVFLAWNITNSCHGSLVYKYCIDFCSCFVFHLTTIKVSSTLYLVTGNIVSIFYSATGKIAFVCCCCTCWLTTGDVVSSDIVWWLLAYRKYNLHLKDVGIRLFAHKEGDLRCFCLSFYDKFHLNTNTLEICDCL